jgi:hypothetical protein
MSQNGICRKHVPLPLYDELFNDQIVRGGDGVKFLGFDSFELGGGSGCHLKKRGRDDALVDELDGAHTKTWQARGLASHLVVLIVVLIQEPALSQIAHPLGGASTVPNKGEVPFDASPVRSEQQPQTTTTGL